MTLHDDLTRDPSDHPRVREGRGGVMADVRILTWDWREQPSFVDLRAIIHALSGGRVDVAEADTGSDQYALVFSTDRLTQAEATGAYRNWYLSGDGHG
jgi:hypothetical protein